MTESGAVSGNSIRLTGDTYNHMKNVLRLRVGDEVSVSDGTGVDYTCKIAKYEDGEAFLEILDYQKSAAELPVDLVLYQGFPKGDKLELIIQKATELGASGVVPVMMARSVVKLDEKKATKRVERYRSIATNAAEQSKRNVVPEVGEVISYKKALEEAKECDFLLLPYEEAKGMEESRKILAEIQAFIADSKKNTENDAHGLQKKPRIGILIGPEGGFAPSEVEDAKVLGARVMSLGHRILRTETAGLMLLSVLGFMLDGDE